MLTPPTTGWDAPPAGSRVLEIVSGPRRGARLRVEAGGTLTVGHDYGCDVVIRHPSTRGMRARLMVAADGVSVDVESGRIMLSGLTIEPGRTVTLPYWTPFSIGDARIVVGLDDPTAWRACRRLARRTEAVPAMPGLALAGRTDEDEAATAPEAGGPPPGRRMPRWWPVPLALTLLPALAVLLLSMLPAPTAQAPSADPRPADAIRALLADEGFGHLHVRAEPAGPPVVAGLVDRDEDRARLASRLQAAGVNASLDLASGGQLARQVDDVMRLHGVAAQVRHLGRGIVEVKVPGARPERLADAVAAVRRDVRGLADLTVESAPETGRAASAVAVSTAPAPDPGKRVVSVVYGRNGYIVTVDGARYFEGALLPSGHRIALISETEVRLERDGQVSRLTL